MGKERSDNGSKQYKRFIKYEDFDITKELNKLLKKRKDKKARKNIWSNND